MIRTNLLLLIVVIVLSNCKNNSSKESDTDNSSTSPVANTSVTNPTTAAPAADLASKPDGPLPTFQFEKSDHDFGEVMEGEVLEYTFKFTNTGEAPLIVSSVKPSCGCTVTSKPNAPIPIGGSDQIVARFDTKGKTGTQIKNIAVNANTWPTTNQLTIRANVKKSSEPTPSSK